MTPASNDKLDTYKTHQRKGETDREIEARALLSCAGQLAAVAHENSDRKVYADAIRHNQRLWTIFQVALCDPGNPVPLELKTILLNLSCYVDKLSFRALAEFKPGLLHNLVDINRSIAAGLSKKPAAEQTAAPVPMPPPGTSIMTTA